jgi:SAM-dependent methyltransferase
VFALQARTAGFEVLAFEQDATCCAYLRDVVGVEARETDTPEKLLREVTGASAIALWQVIEHLPDPLGLVDAAADALAPGGVLVIATPNPTSLGFRRMRRRWPHLDAPRHLWLIPPDVLTQRARAAGLELVTLTFDDAGSRSWNRFAWQRLLMNEVRGRTAQRIGFVIGAVLSMAASPFERRGRRPSSYTVILRKA